MNYKDEKLNKLHEEIERYTIDAAMLEDAKQRLEYTVKHKCFLELYQRTLNQEDITGVSNIEHIILDNYLYLLESNKYEKPSSFGTQEAVRFWGNNFKILSFGADVPIVEGLNLQRTSCEHLGLSFFGIQKFQYYLGQIIDHELELKGRCSLTSNECRVSEQLTVASYLGCIDAPFKPIRTIVSNDRLSLVDQSKIKQKRKQL